MARVVALLAAVVAVAGMSGCGGDGAEPGASREATLVLDFQPNAVHAGLYAARERGLFAEQGIELEIREPSASTDAPKLLAAGRAELAILDVNDLAIARERGLGLVAIAPIVTRPLASVVAADRDVVTRPRDLEGGRVGVTGLPSDDAVLDSVLAGDGADPRRVERVTIGFDSVAALAAGRLDAATAFWNAEGVALGRLDVPVRVFRVDRYGAPRYPELVLTTTAQLLRDDPSLIRAAAAATRRARRLAAADPGAALDELLGAVPGLERSEQEAQMRALTAGRAFAGDVEDAELRAYSRWSARRGVVDDPGWIRGAFAPGFGG